MLGVWTKVPSGLGSSVFLAAQCYSFKRNDSGGAATDSLRVQLWDVLPGRAETESVAVRCDGNISSSPYGHFK